MALTTGVHNMKASTKKETLADLFEAYRILHKLGYTKQRDQIQELMAELNS